MLCTRSTLLFYSGWNFVLCCCGMFCKQRYLSPKFDFARGELLIDGVDFHQTFIAMKMDNPVLNRAYQVVSAVGQAARLQFLNAEKLAEDLQAQRPRYDAASAGAVFVPELSSGTGPVYPAAPHTTFEMSVLVSIPSPQPAISCLPTEQPKCTPRHLKRIPKTYPPLCRIEISAASPILPAAFIGPGGPVSLSSDDDQ